MSYECEYNDEQQLGKMFTEINIKRITNGYVVYLRTTQVFETEEEVESNIVESDTYFKTYPEVLTFLSTIDCELGVE
jgi:hypothetical protein